MSPPRTSSSARSSAQRSCSTSQGCSSALSPGRPARWCMRSGASSARSSASCRGRRCPSTARSSTSSPATGCALGVGALAGYLVGAIAAGALMAVFLANSGGAWDNAKKLVEDGHHGGKGSPAHEATIIGDTVGDPFKDTAGPAINPLLKVMNLVALLIAPLIVRYSVGVHHNAPLRIAIAVVAFAIIAGAVLISKRRPVAVGAGEDEAT